MIINKLLTALMLLIALFSIIVAASTFKISKTSKLHQLNTQHLKYVIQLNDLIASNPNVIPDTEALKNIVQKIKAQPQECIEQSGSIDLFIMRLINTESIITICKKDVKLADELIKKITLFEQGKVTSANMIANLNQSSDRFKANSIEFIKPVDKLSDFILKTSTTSIIILSVVFFLIAFAISKAISNVVVSMQKTSNELLLSEEKLQLSSRVFRDTHEGIMITDAQQLIVDVNPAFTDITGYTHDEIIGQSPKILSSGKQSTQFYAQMWNSITQHGHWRGEVWNRTKQGKLYSELLNISSLTNNSGAVTHYVAVFSDITSIKKQQDKLNLMAHYDVLTKLPNRALFIDRFHQSIAHSKRTGFQLAVCFLDLDDFKPVNDNYGHEAGDRLLVEVADRIMGCIREEDTVSRQGGDEFAILLNDIETTSQYEVTMQRIHQVLAQPYFIDGVQHIITASSGITLYPTDNGDIDTLLRHADHAMYQSKLSGKHRSQLYSPDSDQRIIQKHLQLEEIEQALVQREFQLYYQPKVNMVTGKVFGAEALIRWFHPEKGLIPPLDFLPYIDGTPLESKIGEWVINEALHQLEDWQQQGIAIEVSVNISSNHLLSSSFFTVLEKCLAEHPSVDAKCLQLEILESSALGDINAITKIIETCQNLLGVSASLDDFGTGYSSLTHLRSLPVNTIKIDQSFVRDMLDDPSDYSIIDGVISLSKSFNRNVIAEGVETTKHGLLLILMGCEQAQGYGIAKPMPATDLCHWLDSYLPNKQWLICGTTNLNMKEKSLEIFKLITSQWQESIRAKVEATPNNVKPWPILDSTACHCGNWIRLKTQEQLFARGSMLRLENVHDEIHAIALEIQRKYQSGDIKTARADLSVLALAFGVMNNAIESLNT
ncbi:EAL domain-containing protein [Paraglaciecola sp. 20A4]|uniref:EAL domain-containing protein n=1 Tax=Paraglaciecola sp. 20A4 TaxID=2687288 RepID=UPI0014086229|nr:EAL domain-containing protein [Paraglaciecola sp. 20A4]